MTTPQGMLDTTKQAISIVAQAGEVYQNHEEDGAWLAMEQTYVRLISDALSRQGAAPQGREALEWIERNDRYWTAHPNDNEILERSETGNVRIRGIYGRRAHAALALTPAVAPEHKESDKHEQREANIKSMVADRDRARSVDFSDAETMRPVPATPALAPDGAGEALEAAHKEELGRLGEMQADKSIDAVSTNWQGGRVNGLATALMIVRSAALAQAQEPGEDKR